MYWIGPQAGRKYEAQVTQKGEFYLRYLPSDAKADTPGRFTTVGTYPVKNWYSKIQRALKRRRSLDPVAVPGDAIAGALRRKRGQNVYVAFADKPDLQVELYDPSARRARSLVQSDRVLRLR